MRLSQSPQQSKVVAVAVPVLPTEDQDLPMLVNVDNEAPTFAGNPFVVVPENVADEISSYGFLSIALCMSETSQYNKLLSSNHYRNLEKLRFLYSFVAKLLAIQSLCPAYKGFLEGYLSEFLQNDKSGCKVWPTNSDLSDSAA